MGNYLKAFKNLAVEIRSLPKESANSQSSYCFAENYASEKEELDARYKVVGFWERIPSDIDDILLNDVSALNFTWTRQILSPKMIFEIEACWSISGYSLMAKYIENDPILTDQLDDKALASQKYLMQLIKEEKFLPIGQFQGVNLLVRPEGESHSLHLYWNDCRPPSRLAVRLGGLLDCALQVRGITEFPLYLTEEFPEQLEGFLYSGFFEKVERLFPDANLEGFRHRERCDFQQSVVLRNGRLDYDNRIQEAFLFMPEGTRFQRWHPDADVRVFPDDLMKIWYYQLLYGVKFSDAMEAFYNASQKLEVCWTVDGSVKARFDFPRLQQEIFPKGHAPEYYGLSPEDEPHLVGKYVFYTDQYNDMLVEFEGDGLCSFHLLYLEADDHATHHITDDFDWLFTQLLNTRGMYWWNYFLVFKPSAGDQRYLQFHKQMREYFPDADMSLYPDPAGL